ncbi:MAG: ABC transporter permease [Planctomycetaceae bacterium]|nr:ABC transporter permease [Planctomycetaceae bacterium]
MNLLVIAFKSLKQRALSSALTALSVALGIMLVVSVLVVNGVVENTFNQKSVGVSLLVGPRGSDLGNVLSAVYRIGKPAENLPWRVLTEDLSNAAMRIDGVKSPEDVIEWAIPMTMGDVTEKGAFPVVGTTPKYFKMQYAFEKNFTKKGKLPVNPFDAVVGSQVARQNGWDVGSQFTLIHGGADTGHVHDEKFTVTALLGPTGTANDQTVFVNIEGFFLISGHEKPPEEAIQRLKDFGFEVTEEQAAVIREASVGHDDHGHDDHGHAPHSIPDDLKEVSFILVRTKKPMASIMLSSEINEGMRAQAVNPIQVISKLMNLFVGNTQKILLCLTGLIVVVAGIGIFVSIYNSMSDRKREIAIMRALGASRVTVFSIILSESLLLCLGGGILGLLMGHGLVVVAAPFIESQAGIMVNPWSFDVMELVLFPILIGMATLVGFLPGLTAYRTDVADSLND